MARRPNIDYTAVREMRIHVIAELWYEELGVPYALLEQELRLAALNLPRLARGEGLIPEIPPDDQLPPVTTRLAQWEVIEFCKKQKGWPLPSFWFPEEAAQEVRPRGRPSHMPAILQKMEERARNDELEATVTDEARVLNDWAVEQGHRRYDEKSIRNRIGRRYRELKVGH